MDILPIEKIREEDAPLVGPQVVNLAKLAQWNFPVARGMVVFPPDFRLKTILKSYNLRDKEIFEQSLTIIRKELSQIPQPDEFIKALKRERVDPKKLWLELLEIWLSNIRARIWKQGLSLGTTLNLLAETIFFTDKISSSGRAFFEPSLEQVIVEIDSGEMGEGMKAKLDKLVMSANKKLFIPQNFFWIVEGKRKDLKIVKLTPFTPRHIDKLETSENFIIPKVQKDVKIIAGTVKVFVAPSTELTLPTQANGIFLRGEKFTDLDSLVFRLVETAKSFPVSPLILRLSDHVDTFGGVRGALKLIHQTSILKPEVEAFNFARNKKRLLNLQIGIPFVRSVNEFLQIKRDLATLGVSRKGTLKLWLEVNVPENLINLEEYLLAGLDGVIINLDELSSWLGGFDLNQPEAVFYKKQINALLKFLEDGLRILHKSKIPVLFSGELALHDEILKLIIARGIWGVIVTPPNAHSLSEHLKYLEKRQLNLN